MNTLTLFIAAMSGGEGIKGLILEFLVAVLIIGAIGGLIYCIERWIGAIPDPGKTIIAIVLVILLIAWAVTKFL